MSSSNITCVANCRRFFVREKQHSSCVFLISMKYCRYIIFYFLERNDLNYPRILADSIRQISRESTRLNMVRNFRILLKLIDF